MFIKKKNLVGDTRDIAGTPLQSSPPGRENKELPQLWATEGTSPEVGKGQDFEAKEKLLKEVSR